MAENYVRTAAELERKYNLSQLPSIKKASEENAANIQSTQGMITEFAASVETSLQDLQSQIDGDITTWFYNGTPTLNNLPASEWTTTEEKDRHLGDLYYDNESGSAYRFIVTSGVYSWSLLSDSAVTEALALAQAAQDTADNKRRVFVATPTPPYDIGDLWAEGSSGDIKKCKAAKADGESYSSSDWELASKYTDDSSLNNFITNTYTGAINSLESQIDAKSETWYQSTDPSANWSTTALKDAHMGDLWYDTTNNKSYMYKSDYSWGEVDGVPDSVYNKIDGKAQVFVSQPTPPYSVGDLWVQGSTGDIKKCKTARASGNYSSGDWELASKYTDDGSLTTFVNGTYASNLATLNSNINSKITTWYYSGVPTLSNAPAVNWTTNEEKAKHVGDLYYDSATGYAYRFNYSSSTYSWGVIHDDGIAGALSVANEARDIATDHKRRIFYTPYTEDGQTYTTPQPPYDTGDLWVKDDNKIMACKIGRVEGASYTASDWVDAAKYTADQEAATAIENFKTTYVDTTFATKTELTSTESSITARVSRDEIADILKNIKYFTNGYTPPSSGWSTNSEKARHVGEVWYDYTDGNAYVYTYKNTYYWETIDLGENTIFMGNPTIPYYRGDILLKRLTQDRWAVYVCQVSRTTGSADVSDFVLQPMFSTTADLTIKADEINATVSTKADASEVTKASIVTKINDNTYSQVQIDADQVDITANDVLNILSGNQINMTSKNISIYSTNFEVTAAGALRCTNATMNNANVVGGSITLSDDGDISTESHLVIDNSSNPNVLEQSANMWSSGLEFLYENTETSEDTDLYQSTFMYNVERQHAIELEDWEFTNTSPREEVNHADAKLYANRVQFNWKERDGSYALIADHNSSYGADGCYVENADISGNLSIIAKPDENASDSGVYYHRKPLFVEYDNDGDVTYPVVTTDNILFERYIGDANHVGYDMLTLGNNIASPSDGNSRGLLRLYSSTAYYVNIVPVSLSNVRTINIPNHNGTLECITQLYSNTSGVSGNFTLSETAANFDFLEIHYAYGDTNSYRSMRVFAPNGKKIQLTGSYSTPSATYYLYQNVALYTISGTSVTKNEEVRWRFATSGNPTRTTGATNIKIYKVYGIKTS